MGNTGLLTVVVLLLIGIFIMLAIQYYENQKTPAQKISDGISETVEEIGDEIDDHTTTK